MPRSLPPSRTRRVAKWTGLVVCVVILAMWAVSTTYWIRYHAADVPFTLVASRGSTVLFWPGPYVGPPGWGMGPGDQFGLSSGVPGVRFFELQGIGRVLTIVEIPHWLLLTLAAIPTALLWRRDRRTVKPGHCPTCGYNLTGAKHLCCPVCCGSVPA